MIDYNGPSNAQVQRAQAEANAEAIRQMLASAQHEEKGGVSKMAKPKKGVVPPQLRRFAKKKKGGSKKGK